MVENTTPQHCPGYADFKNLKVVTCKCAKCAVKKKKFFQMNLIRNTFAKDATHRSILVIAQLKAKAKAFPLVRALNRINRE